MSGWQPIETAPKTGTRILTCFMELGRCYDLQINHFNDPKGDGNGLGRKGWWCSDDRWPPTHWLPIPLVTQ